MVGFIKLLQQSTGANRKDNLGKFELKVDEGIFLGYSLHGHAYIEHTIREPC